MKFELVKIQKIDSYETNNEVVYDITVEDDSSYCVQNNIAVHNSACTTKNATGIYDKPISLISECYRVKQLRQFGTKIIADGGISEPSQFVKSIAAGADFVMLGSEIAKTTDSPAELLKIPIVNNEFKFYKVYHGSASEDTQKLYRNKIKYIEGRSKLLDFHNEPLIKVINRYMEGLRSSMSYFDARSLIEYREKVIFGLV